MAINKPKRQTNGDRRNERTIKEQITIEWDPIKHVNMNIWKQINTGTNVNSNIITANKTC